MLSSAERKITLEEILSCCTSDEISYIDLKLPGNYLKSISLKTSSMNLSETRDIYPYFKNIIQGSNHILRC